MKPKKENIIAIILLVCVCGTIGMIEKDKILFFSSPEYIPVSVPIETPQTIIEPTEPTSPTNTININTATKEELMTLPGIGDKLSDEIINYRTSTPFNSIEDIKNVNGIGDKKFEEISNFICID